MGLRRAGHGGGDARRAGARRRPAHRQGSEYTARAFGQACERLRSASRWARPGSALDNAEIESWHSNLEFELRRRYGACGNEYVMGLERRVGREPEDVRLGGLPYDICSRESGWTTASADRAAAGRPRDVPTRRDAVITRNMLASGSRGSADVRRPSQASTMVPWSGRQTMEIEDASNPEDDA